MYSSIWVRGLRAINKAWFGIISAGGVLGGIITGQAIGGFVGFLSFIGISAAAFILGFMLVGLVMTFLDLAEDVSYIAVNTKTSQQQNVFNAFTEESKKEHEKNILSNGGWKCSVCGKSHPSYTGTCGCGNSKNNNESVQ